MWQTIDLNNYADRYLIDNQLVKYNLSAWLGGYTNQNDNVVVSLLFQDQFNQTIGNGTQIGPVFAIDRGNKTSLLFRQTNGLIPIGAYTIIVVVRISFTTGNRNNGDLVPSGAYSLGVWVRIVVLSGPYNNGDVDNSNIFLYS